MEEKTPAGGIGQTTEGKEKDANVGMGARRLGNDKV
jgi:hypothetical protein